MLAAASAMSSTSGAGPMIPNGMLAPFGGPGQSI
jgi:hypothetical protein